MAVLDQCGAEMDELARVWPVYGSDKPQNGKAHTSHECEVLQVVTLHSPAAQILHRTLQR